MEKAQRYRRDIHSKKLPAESAEQIDIVDNNSIPRENFDNEFFKLIGDILYHIIITQAEDNTSEPINRTNNAEQPSN